MALIRQRRVGELVAVPRNCCRPKTTHLDAMSDFTPAEFVGDSPSLSNVPREKHTSRCARVRPRAISVCGLFRDQILLRRYGVISWIRP